MGNLEGHPPDVFYEILPKDEVDPTHTEDGVENLTSMVLRMSNVLRDVDKKFEGKLVVVVSHGDPLSCIYAVCNDVSPCVRIKKFSFFRNCEIREVEYLTQFLN